MPLFDDVQIHTQNLTLCITRIWTVLVSRRSGVDRYILVKCHKQVEKDKGPSRILDWDGPARFLTARARFLSGEKSGAAVIMALSGRPH